MSELLSTKRMRSAVFLAAMSFAVSHILAISTVVDAGGDFDADLPVQLVHAMAVLARFVLPAMFFGIGLAGFSKRHS